jgi:hypothetical protein
VFGRYFINGHYFSPFRSELIQYDDSDSDSNIITYLRYYVMCLGARFYDYLASSEIRKKLSSKIDTVTLAS